MSSDAAANVNATWATVNRTNDWGSATYKYCKQPYNWTELITGYKTSSVRMKSGGLGKLLEAGKHEVGMRASMCERNIHTRMTLHRIHNKCIGV